MAENIIVRFFYLEAPPCKCGKCNLNRGLLAYQSIAESLANDFEGLNLSFEAYNSLNVKDYEFLQGRKAPALAVNDVIVSSGRMPQLSEVKAEIIKQIGPAEI